MEDEVLAIFRAEPNNYFFCYLFWGIIRNHGKEVVVASSAGAFVRLHLLSHLELILKLTIRSSTIEP